MEWISTELALPIESKLVLLNCVFKNPLNGKESKSVALGYYENNSFNLLSDDSYKLFKVLSFMNFPEPN